MAARKVASLSPGRTGESVDAPRAARLQLMQCMPILPIGSGRGRAHGFCDLSLDLERRRPGDGSRLVFATLQDGLRDIIAPPPSALGGVARAHPVAAVIEQLAGEERV
jgi:hypothetical protein